MSTIFTKIIRGEISSHKIMEDDRFLAFLDVRPIKPGHTLVIPKEEIDYFFDLEDQMLGDLMVFAKKVARLLRQAVPCQRIGVMVAGLEVPHVHVHLIPMTSIADLNFAHATPAESQELAKMAERIRRHKEEV